MRGAPNVNVFNIDMEAPVFLTAKLDEFGRPAWIGVAVLGFLVFWPLGVALLVFLALSGRLQACRSDGPWQMAAPGRWYAASGEPAGPGAQGGPGRGFGCGWRRRRHAAPPSGNAAFDEYRAETIRRLEEEQREFMEYLDRLRRAKDKAEFDQFMADRRRFGGGAPEPGTSPAD